MDGLVRTVPGLSESLSLNIRRVLIPHTDSQIRNPLGLFCLGLSRAEKLEAFASTCHHIATRFFLLTVSAINSSCIVDTE